MLRIFASNSVAAAKTYYTTNMRGEYYAAGTEQVGKWHGKAARALGLGLAVDQATFERMCENRHPITGEQLTPGNNPDHRRVLYDCNFHLPKSASIAWAVKKDDRIIEAMEAVSGEVMAMMETYAGTRVRKDGKDEDRRTGNLAWASFVHHTSRPTDDRVPDMHLHTHLTAFNLTWDDVESRWKAAQFGDIKKHAPMFEAVFMSRMAEEMRKLGYTVRRDGKYWELAEVDKASRKQFSQRTTEIEAEAERLGLTDAKAKGEIGKNTRKRKAPFQLSECMQGWHDAFSDTLRAGFTRKPESDDGKYLMSLPDDIIDKAAEHFCENKTHFTYEELMGKCCQLASDGELAKSGRTTFEVFRDRIEERIGHSLLAVEMDGQRIMTTREMLAREKKILAWARDGVGDYKPLVRGVEALQPMDRSKPELQWAPDQSDAITHVWSNTDRLTLIRGVAGSGKSTLFREAARGIEKHGTGVVALAPTNSSMNGLQGTTEHVYTFQAFLSNPDLQKACRGKLLWLDEAGMAGSKDILAFLETAERYDNRVVFMGDSKQTSSVTAGDVLRQLEERGGLTIKTVKTIQRQRRENYRTMVQDLSDGTARSIDRAFDTLEAATKVREAQQTAGLADSEAAELGGFCVMPEADIYDQVAKDFLAAIDDGKSVVAVAPTHRECDRINQAVREGLKERGIVSTKGARTYKTHRLINMSETDKEDAARYVEGTRIGFHKRHGRFKAGDYATVVEVNGHSGRVKVIDAEGMVRGIKLKNTKNFDLYNFTEIELAKGDSVILNRNTRGIGKKYAMKKGAEHTITGFDASGNIRLSNGQKIRRDMVSLSYNYATTIHSAQGRTVDRALYVHLSHFGDRAMMYVGASRARDFVKVYTENLDELRTVVGRSGAALTAMEIEEASLAAAKAAAVAVGVDPLILDEERRMTAARRLGVAAQDHLFDRGRERSMEIGL